MIKILKNIFSRKINFLKNKENDFNKFHEWHFSYWLCFFYPVIYLIFTLISVAPRGGPDFWNVGSPNSLRRIIILLVFLQILNSLRGNPDAASNSPCPTTPTLTILLLTFHRILCTNTLRIIYFCLHTKYKKISEKFT